MRVLHISSAKSMRGGEHQVCLLISELSSLGIENILLCPSGSELSKRQIPGLTKLVTYMKLSPANILVSAFIKKLGDKENVDIIHLHDPHSHQFAFYAYRLFSNKIASVVTRRVSFPIKNSSRPYYTHPLIKQVICVSNSVADSLKNLRLEKNKIRVIPSGIVLADNNDDLSLRKKFNIGSDINVIANLAAISPQKDYITFVKTASVFLKRYDHKVIFVIVGADQGDKAKVQSLINELGVSEHIIFTGYIREAYRYLLDVDVLLSTSVSEGLGNTIQESMKYKTTIVATNCEGTIDLVEDQVSALLANIGDHDKLAEQVNQVLSDDDLAKKLTEKAYAAIQRYDIKKTSKLVLDLYTEVLSLDHNI